MPRIPLSIAAASLLALLPQSLLAQPLPPAPAGVQVTTAYGFEFSTIGHPGNRAANQAEAPMVFPPYSTPPMSIGAVNTEFRIARTNVTAAQWLEFVNAYAPYSAQGQFDRQFTSDYLRPVDPGDPHPVLYQLKQPYYADRPVGVSWYSAARYCNWLHNDKRTDPAAFESGVYDSSTFGHGPNGVLQRLAPRAPDAKFFMPSLDEYIKAVYYDPNRYGPGQEGFWQQPTGSNTPLITGWPEDGGQTAAGIPYPLHDPLRELNILSYPSVQTPTGLFDISGLVGTKTDTWVGYENVLFGLGSSTYSDPLTPEIVDRLDALGASDAFTVGGIRIAAAIPTPSAALPLTIALLTLRTRRRPAATLPPQI